jgi:hypothetical protein
LWGLTIRETPNVEDAILSLLEQKDPEALSKIWLDKDSEETLLETWRKSGLAKELDRLLRLLESGEHHKPEKRKRRESSSNIASAAHSQATQQISPAFQAPTALYGQSEQLTQQHQHQKLPQRSSSNFQPPSVAPPAVDPQLETSSPVELPYNTWDLLDIYFAYTHCWLPIVEKHNLLRTSYLYPLHISANQEGSGDHALLFAILAYASAHQEGISRQMALGNNPPANNPWTSARLYKKARSLVGDEDCNHELGHVQALLIMSLLNMGNNRWKQAWMLIGDAVRLAIDLGLADHPDDGKSRIRHTYFGCFILETLVSARLRRIPHLRYQGTLAHGVIHEDGLDEWNPWQDAMGIRRNAQAANVSRGPGAALSTYNRLFRTTCALSTLICNSGSNEIQEEVSMQLYKNLNQDHKDGMLPHQYHAELMYIATQALLPLPGLARDAHARTRLLQILILIKRDFGLLAVPPTFDCIIHAILNNEKGVPLDSPFTFGATSLKVSLAEMGKTWPTFMDTFDKFCISMPGPPLPQQSPYNQATPHFISVGRSGSTADSPANQRGSVLDQGETPSTTVFTPSGQSILEAAIQFDPYVLSGQANTQAPQTSPWPGSANLPSQAQRKPDNLTDFASQLNNPQSQSFYSPLNPDIDGDRMFNEFATLDAMKWYVFHVSVPSFGRHANMG